MTLLVFDLVPCIYIPSELFHSDLTHYTGPEKLSRYSDLLVFNCFFTRNPLFQLFTPRQSVTYTYIYVTKINIKIGKTIKKSVTRENYKHYYNM